MRPCGLPGDWFWFAARYIIDSEGNQSFIAGMEGLIHLRQQCDVSGDDGDVGILLQSILFRFTLRHLSLSILAPSLLGIGVSEHPVRALVRNLLSSDPRR